jgi:spore maturation protein CgeB
LDLAVWGPGWDALPPNSSLKNHLRGRHTRPEEWLKIYSASKIILSTHYHDPHKRFPVYQASPRVFEILACGAFQICDDQRDVFTLFQNGRDLVRFTDAPALVDKVEYYLSHPQERREIAERGRQTVLAHHTYRDRILTLIREITLSI